MGNFSLHPGWNNLLVFNNSTIIIDTILDYLKDST